MPRSEDRSAHLAGAALLWALALILAACGGFKFGDGRDVAEFCASAEVYAETASADLPSSRDPAENIEQLGQRISLLRSQLIDTEFGAPSKVEEALIFISSYDYDTLRVSERERFADAKQLVEEFIRDKCDLAFEI